MKEKKKFVEPEMEIVLFHTEDVIRTSGGFEVGTELGENAFDGWSVENGVE